jgi:hypothetical protein
MPQHRRHRGAHGLQAGTRHGSTEVEVTTPVCGGARKLLDICLLGHVATDGADPFRRRSGRRHSRVAIDQANDRPRLKTIALCVPKQGATIFSDGAFSFKDSAALLAAESQSEELGSANFEISAGRGIIRSLWTTPAKPSTAQLRCVHEGLPGEPRQRGHRLWTRASASRPAIAGDGSIAAKLSLR